MRIRTRLRIAIATALGAAVVIALTVGLVSRQMGDNMIRVRLHADLVRQVSALNTLRGDYMRGPNQRAYEQGQAALRSLRTLLDEVQPLDDGERITLDALRANANDLAEYFARLQTAAATSGQDDPTVAAMRERMDSLLAVKVNLMFDEISGLAETSQATMTATQQATQAVAVIVALLVLAVSVLALVLTSRRIDGSIQRLREGTALLTGDRLDRRVEVRGSDEITELAAAFNAMADRLEQDFSERTRTADDLRRLNRELRALSASNQALVRATDEQALLEDVCRIICDGAGYQMAWVGRAEQDAARTIRPLAWAGLEDGYLFAGDISWDAAKPDVDGTGTAVRTGTIARVPDFTIDPGVAPWRPAALERGYRSSLALPLAGEGGETFGALAIYSTEADAFTPDETRLLEELAQDLAFGTLVMRTRAERDGADAALRASEEQYRRFVEDDVTGVVVATPEARLITCNPAFARMLGFTTTEEMLGTSIATFHQDPVEHRAFMTELRTRGRVEGREMKWRRRDGSTMIAIDTAIGDFDAAGELVAVRGYLIDTTERRRLEEDLRQAQKMEAVGRLAGGVAHDFNNMLTAINGYAGILASSMVPDDERLGDVEEIRKAGDRAAALTRQLLAFSRRQVLQPRVIDLNAVVSGIVPMLRRLVGEQIDIRTLEAPDLGHVRADPGQVEQILLNLVVNARDAMPRGGTVTIGTTNVSVAENGVHAAHEVHPGPYVQLAVTDTGTGMDASTVAHLFEPFFTTKPAGEGTGLGLATVYGIVTQSGGHTTVESEPGRGSTFRVYLPRVAAPVEPVPAAAASAPGGSQEILVVDDEDGIRAFAERVLRELGYDVSVARSGDEAIALVTDHPGRFDLLVTDVVLPGMDGRQLSDRLTARERSLRTLFISGYARDALVHQGVLDPDVAFLGKPFTPLSLGRAVRDVLDGPHPVRPEDAAVGDEDKADP
jgi:two-component system, cell cycle sensor histidine kinase and response regulator CckA